MFSGKNSYLWGKNSAIMMLDKAELRKKMRQLNRSLSPEERARLSEELWHRVEESEAFRRARCVAFFCSLPDEPDTTPALARWRSSKRLLVPRVEGEVMHFYDYAPERMAAGSFGITEPEAADPVDPAEIDLILVPGVAFTRSGDRMGRGKGFYDKYLPALRPDAVKIGICYPHQFVEFLPTEPHDVAVSIL